MRPYIRFLLAIVTAALIATQLGTGGGSGPVAYGGFSTGGWYGDGTIASENALGIVDASVGSMSALCYPTTRAAADAMENAAYSGAITRLLGTSGKSVSAFWFLTSYYHIKYQCATPAPDYDYNNGFAVTPWRWGIVQADLFIYFTNVAVHGNGAVLRYLGDLEAVPYGSDPDLAGLDARHAHEQSAGRRWVRI